MKLLRSILRTAFAIGIIIFSGMLLYHTINWESWIPNNDFGAFACAMFWFSSLEGIAYGVYEISPIFWTALIGALASEYYGGSLKKIRREVIKLRKKYIW